MPDASDAHREAAAPGSAPDDASPPRAEGTAQLPDPWSRRGALPLDGALERGGGLSPLLMALLVLAGTFVLFQVVGAVVAGGLMAIRGVSSSELGQRTDPTAVQELISVSDLVIGNSVGQVLGLAVPALFVAWLHSSRVRAFLRLRRPPLFAVGLALGGVAGLLPAVGWLTELNQQVPLPEFMRMLEETRMEMIRQVLESNLGLWVDLLGLAVVPAFCEELIFRGYAQRQLERSLGVAGGVVLTGVLFGAYHLSLAQILPLSVLGVYLAYLTWRTGSLWPAIAAHFANNAFAVMGAQVAASRPDVSLAEVEGTSWPWYILVGGLILFAVSLFFLHTRAARWRPSLGRSPEK